ncbi:MAG: ABC transporter ATP-binding protein [Solirubrobacteraceae bacterium]
MFTLAGVTAGYGRTVVLRDVHLTVPPGRVVALLGANGAGKTTLLRVASGLLRPNSGRLVLDGVDCTGTSPEALCAKGICHVPEGRGVFPSLTVRENLRLFGQAGAEAAGIERAVDAFPRPGERLEQLAGHMSGGEQQMCAIGRALMVKPRLLMIDELSLGLAPVIVDRLMEAIDEIHRGGTTLLIVEQDVVNATTMAQRGYVMESGQIVLEGTSEMLLKDQRVQDSFIGL